MSGSIAEKSFIKVEKYPANWSSYGKAAGPIRNSIMVNTFPDIVMVFHESIDSLKGSKGTKSFLMLLKKNIESSSNYKPIIYFNGIMYDLNDLI